MPPNPFTDLGPDFVRRFRGFLVDGLAKSVLTDMQRTPAALVPAAGETSRLSCGGYIAGKDVLIVLVRAKRDADGKPLPVKETLTYRKDVAGTDLVYDLTGEFLQGKARPFDCDLRDRPARLYALLPFQVENLAITARQQPGKVTIEVELQNALRKRVEGALPCHAELRMPDGKVGWERFLATSPEGTLTEAAELPLRSPHGKWSLIVRSLLDGKEVTVPIEVGSTVGK